MQAALAAMLATLPEDRRRGLMRVQEAWSHWLAARCDFIDGPFEGSEAKVEAALCRVNTIAERADELAALQRPAMLAPNNAPP